MSEDWENGGFGLYIHWPFCAAKCPYCDFNSHVRNNIDQKQWLRSYLSEINRVSKNTSNRSLNSVFFGGGTPSLIEPWVINDILNEIQKFSCVQETSTYHKKWAMASNFLLEDKSRMKYVANMIEEVSKTGNTLVLTGRISNGNLLQELLPGSEFVQGSMKVVDRKETYNDINDATNSITIATYGVAAVGINIPRIFNLVLLEPGKSFVRVIQSIGRGVRIAKDKDFVQIWDVTSRCKFSRRHLTERKKYYKEAEYPFTIDKVNY